MHVQRSAVRRVCTGAKSNATAHCAAQQCRYTGYRGGGLRAGRTGLDRTVRRFRGFIGGLMGGGRVDKWRIMGCRMYVDAWKAVQ